MIRISSVVIIVLLCMAGLNAVDVTFDVSKPGSRINPKHLSGTCLPIWNSTGTYDIIKKGLQAGKYGLFRFPNGSISNAYHWNGTGGFNTDGVWVCSSSVYTPGFMSRMLHRGTSKYHYGEEAWSHVTDGDTSTFWWSDPLITTKASYLYLEFSPAATIDSLVLYWGEKYAKAFAVEIWQATSTFYPGPHQTDVNKWKSVYAASGNGQTVCPVKLTEATSTAYLRIVATEVNGANGVQIKEIYGYYQGAQVTKNEKAYTGTTGQTKVVAIGSAAACEIHPDWDYLTWDFEKFMAYCNSFSYGTIPVICVNYALGSPEEAAAWVQYANRVKNYNIQYWQIGNEMDGAWEEGGPVTAAMYTEKYLQFAKAMKAVDSSIKIFGPVMAGANVDGNASGEFNNKSWMETFCEIVGAAEKTDGIKYCDGIDFHSYPYYFNNVPDTAAMVAGSDFLYDKVPHVITYINSHLLNPDSVMIFLSEYNSSVVMSSLLNTPVNSVCLANIYGSFIEQTGYRGLTLVWDSYEGFSQGPDGTFGSLSLFNPVSGVFYSSFSKAPSAAFWGTHIPQALWIQQNDSVQRHVKGTYDKSSGLRAYGMLDSKSFRALLINKTSSTLDVKNNVIGIWAFKNIDAISWGSREFGWQGKDAGAYAIPNCGPGSFRVDQNYTDPFSLPPYSITVLDYNNKTSGNSAPAIFHAGAQSTDLSPGKDTLKAWFTAFDNLDIIGGMYYGVDTKDALVRIPPLDDSCNGTYESCFFSVDGSQLSNGSHMLYLCAENGTGQKNYDSIAFEVSGTMKPTILIDNFNDSDMVCELPSQKQWFPHVHNSDSSLLYLTVKGTTPSKNYLYGDFTIKQPSDLSYDNFVVIGLQMDSAYMAQNKSRIKGFYFRYSATHSGAKGRMVVQIPSAKVTDYDDFHIVCPFTDGKWQYRQFQWKECKQAGWGIPVDKLLTEDIREIQFRIEAEGDGEICIDNVAFLNDSGDVIVSVFSDLKQGPGKPLVKILPNHNRGRIVFLWEGRKGANVRLDIYTLQGRLVHSRDSLFVKRNKYVWNYRSRKESVSAGIYMLVVTAGKGMYTQKFSIVK